MLDLTNHPKYYIRGGGPVHLGVGAVEHVGPDQPPESWNTKYHQNF